MDERELEGVSHVALIRARIVERNDIILSMYRRQLDDLQDLNDILNNYELENDLEEWYIDMSKYMINIGIEGSKGWFKPLE